MCELNMRKSRLLPLFLIALSSCAAATDENTINYSGLTSLLENNKATKLCFWYFDNLRSNQDPAKYHLQYICAPSESYNGSRIIVKQRIAISKSEVVINNSGGKITANEIERK
jgi:hypothetical protein